MSIETLVISHRGRGTGEIPNSIASFEKALSLGARGIETDVRLTGDKEAIVSHDDSILDSGRKILIARATLREIIGRKPIDERPLTLDELFYYINQRDTSFFIEVKVPAAELVKQLVEKIKEDDLWDKTHIIGFSGAIGPALDAQETYPRLRVIPFVNLPVAFLRTPKKSHGIFVGWLDDRRGSQTFFRTLISPERLERLRAYYEKLGFRVMAGVVNRPDGLSYFKQAGIRDIVTDEIAAARAVLNS